MNSEVEIKYQVSSFPDIRERLRKDGARLLIPETAEINSVFDLPDGRLIAEGRLLRLREFHGSVLLTVKETCLPGPVKQRKEHQSGLSVSFEEAEEMLHSLGYIPVYSYEKKREIWEYENEVHVCLDTLHFGCFVEIEADTAKKVFDTGESLGFDPRYGIVESYRQLELLLPDTGKNSDYEGIS
jgi:predicted adenylyl cyclase CyaB